MDYLKNIISSDKYNIKEFGNNPSDTLGKLESLVPEELFNSYKNTEYYKKIKNLINHIEVSGTLYRSSGHCIGVSDMLRRLLSECGISSKLVECNLAIIQPPQIVDFIGYNDGTGVNPEIEAPTHVVCVTETPIPFLIDLSVFGCDSLVNYMCFPLDKQFIDHEKNILTLKFEKHTWCYNSRKTNTLIDLHEKSIVDRINTDISIESKINTINKVILTICCITTLNLVRGGFDFYQKYINKTNGFGPNNTTLVK